MIDIDKFPKRTFLNFKDSYGKKFRVYESSACGSYIWLSTDADVQIMASKAQSVGVETNETCGWVEYPIPADCLIRDAVHLNREDAKALIKVLKRFVKTGRLPASPEFKEEGEG